MSPAPYIHVSSYGSNWLAVEMAAAVFTGSLERLTLGQET